MFVCKQKINFHLHVFLEILQRYCNLVILSTLDMVEYPHPKRYYQIVENFCVYLLLKNQFHFPCFSGDIAKMCKYLIWVLWACLVTHIKNDIINFDAYPHTFNKLHHSLLS